MCRIRLWMRVRVPGGPDRVASCVDAWVCGCVGVRVHGWVAARMGGRAGFGRGCGSGFGPGGGGRCLNGGVTETESLLPVGSTAVRRDVFRGRVWTEAPVRVLAADRGSVRTALWPGVVTLAAERFVASGGGRDKALRSAALDDLALGAWGMAEWVWRWTGVVTEVVSGRWFSVARMYNQDGALDCWYVNFERPPSWRVAGWDTMDLAVDLVVEPDGAWRWKDEDEYAQCRRLGLVTDVEHAAVWAAREEAVEAVRAREGLFGVDGGRGDGAGAGRWLPDPAWLRPSLADVSGPSAG